MSAIRCFVAIELPEEVKESLTSLQGILKDIGVPVVRWVNPEGIHLTLKFLGDVEPDRIGDIEKSLAAVVGSTVSFHLALGEAGAFPSPSRPRVLWVGIKGELEPLLALQKKVEDGLYILGFPREGREFKAHLTVGRVREGASQMKVRAVASALSSCPWVGGEAFLAEGLSLIRSQLTPRGAIYSRIFHLAFGH